MKSLLEKINFPKDLKTFEAQQLPEICTELREYLLHTISKVGGHLSSNLGTVELTVALHYVFNTPEDKIIWDVGHQAYAHKVITGRKHLFNTIRQNEGLSGFTSRSESEYDTFGAGHASTAISAATGIATAFKHQSLNNMAIAVVGDGALTGGLSFEALNNCGFIPTKNLVIVFNDNNMSIDPNVGSINHFIQNNIVSSPEKIKEYFEAYGCQYLGLYDGHHVQTLVDVFSDIKKAKTQTGPYFVHIRTLKGKGYSKAEELPIKYHGVTPFKVEEGIQSSIKKMNYQDIFAKTLTQIAKTNEKVIAITAAMPSGTGLVEFQKEIPERFYDVGIAEAHAVLFAAGLACQGLKPVVGIYSTFLQRAYDQVIHDVCLQKLPVVFAMDRAGLVGNDGATHQGVFDLSYLRAIPNLVLMAPKDENELQHMIATAIEYNQGPIAFRYPRGEVVGVTLDKELKPIKIGKAELLHADSHHNDVLIVGLGNCVQTALKIQKTLQLGNISCAIINGRFVKPLDEDLINTWAKRSKLVITIEENSIQGGFGSAILENFAKNKILVQTFNFGVTDTFIEHATQSEQREKVGLDVDTILDIILKHTHKPLFSLPTLETFRPNISR
jgi:1-deoxy-D-xylulose-5-phosphate synthase